MSWYRRQICDCPGCACWKQARNTETAVARLEELLDRAYEARRAARAAYEQHLDQTARRAA